MTLIQLNYFVTVCRFSSFTRAAEALSVSQPAVSVAIRELEQELNVKLLVRDGKTVRPTEAGTTFLQHCRSLLDHAERTVQAMQDFTSGQQRLRLGLTPTLAMTILPRLYRDFRQLRPDLTFEVIEAPRHVLAAKLEQNLLDAVFANGTLELDSKFRKAAVTDHEYCFCVAHDHPLADRNPITLPEIGSTPLVCFGQEYEQPQFLRELFAPQKLEPNLVYEANQLSTITGMAEYNQFGCFLYRALESKWPGLRFLSLDPPVQAQTYLFWRKDTYTPEGIRQLLQCLRSLNQNAGNTVMIQKIWTAARRMEIHQP